MTRVLTALAIAPPVLAIMFFAPPAAFDALVAVVLVGAAWEWSRLMGCATRAGRAAFTALTALAIVAAEFWIDPFVLFVVAAVWWLVAFAWLALAPEYRPGRFERLVKGAAGLLTLVPTFAAITVLHDWDGQGAWRVLFFLALIWLADIGAYFFGRAFGEHKLAPRVSPGKTWEGVFGAFVAAVAVTAAGVAGGLGVGPTAWFAGLCAMTVAVSIVGDLSESMFKRQQGVKDSGTLLPGHGGLLDRIDSLTAAAPVFVGGMILWPG